MSDRLLIHRTLMDQPLPSYRNPPVVETALSVQFKPVKGFKNAHLTLFWQQIRSDFPEIEDAEPIEPHEETFGSRHQRLPSFNLRMGHQGTRLQMADSDGHMMIQLQNGRLVFNWRQLDDGEYPRWNRVYPKFQNAFAQFCQFLKKEGLPACEPTQWEVTYVNKLMQGRDWSDRAELGDIIPGLVGTATRLRTASLEAVGANWRFILPENAGRLHVDLTHGFTGPEEDAVELLVLQLTARGGIDEENGRDLDTGLNRGHKAIVESFSEITGESVQAKWERNE